ncbi:hypothetical protein T484DRAFT_2929988 [Baffinella frigidus]|nr:hypothetical protein T484DRAFT_2929988 [Cryptophyta sp. CCMP2293]
MWAPTLRLCLRRVDERGHANSNRGSCSWEAPNSGARVRHAPPALTSPARRAVLGSSAPLLTPGGRGGLAPPVSPPRAHTDTQPTTSGQGS